MDEMETKLAHLKGNLFIKNKITRETGKLIDKLQILFFSHLTYCILIFFVINFAIAVNCH